MNREINLRAWDKDQERLLDVIEINWRGLMIAYNESALMWDYRAGKLQGEHEKDRSSYDRQHIRQPGSRLHSGRRLTT